MSVRNLDRLFKPRSIALIGASRREGSVGRVLAHNLFHSGFEGPVMPVHPKAEAVEGVLAYDSIEALPLTPDLAVIATPPAAVPDLIARLGARGTRAVVVITAGFGEGGDDAGKALKQAMLDAARPHTLRIVGPNCLGVLSPGQGLNASFSHVAPKTGDLAFIAQSGAMATTILDWAQPRGIGFSQVVTLGSMSDVDFGDMLDYLALDTKTRAILLYVEAVTNARKFMSAARAAARAKPVIVIKGGRKEEGARAASSHTGALAGSDAVYDAAFRRAGMLRVETLGELFDAAETLATAPQVRGDRLSILTNGGGLGVLATDALVEAGGRLAELSPATKEKLDALLPATWSHANPVDIIGDAPGARYAGALKALLEEPQSDAVLVLNCPTAVSDPLDAAKAVVETLDGRRRPVFPAWMGTRAAAESRALFSRRRIPSYVTPERAITGFMHLVRYRRNQEMLMETPDALPVEARPDREKAAAVIEAALRQGGRWLSEAESKAVLAAYAIPVVETRIVASPAEAVESAQAIGFPVALKILSPEITHKSEVGGVELELDSAEAVAAAAQRMLERVRQVRPDAHVDGFTVQAMVRRPAAHELILGMSCDALFGPVMLFGQGGTSVEVVGDTALALPPLNSNLARAMMAETRVHKLLRGYRDRSPAALDAIAGALINLSQLVVDHPEVVEVDINPLLADPKGVIALDARIRVTPPDQPGTRRLAIRPYPQDLESEIALKDGTRLLLRPIRPEDEPALGEAFKRLTPEDIRLRFFAPLRELSHSFAARLTQIDYDREIAFVAIDRRDGAIWGVVRLAADPDNIVGEYAIIVRSDVKGRGLGWQLMQRIVGHGRARGLKRIIGDVLRENTAMLELCEELGFTLASDPEDPQILHVTKDL